MSAIGSPVSTGSAPAWTMRVGRGAAEGDGSAGAGAEQASRGHASAATARGGDARPQYSGRPRSVPSVPASSYSRNRSPSAPVRCNRPRRRFDYWQSSPPRRPASGFRRLAFGDPRELLELAPEAALVRAAREDPRGDRRDEPDRLEVLRDRGSRRRRARTSHSIGRAAPSSRTSSRTGEDVRPRGSRSGFDRPEVDHVGRPDRVDRAPTRPIRR